MRDVEDLVVDYDRNPLPLRNRYAHNKFTENSMRKDGTKQEGEESRDEKTTNKKPGGTRKPKKIKAKKNKITSSLLGYDDIQVVHLELSSNCNAACPQCSRNDFGGRVNPLLHISDISLDQIKQILPVEFIQRLKKIYSCGSFGDPVMARDCLPIYRYLRSINPKLKLGIHTNGGVRSVKWWQDMASIINPQGNIKLGYVAFAIDGLEDTNHIYRQNVQWDNLMRNVVSFIEAGGNARWDMVVFKHNQHLIEEMKDLAQVLGFTRFNPKKTKKFWDRRKLKLRPYTPILSPEQVQVGRLEVPSMNEWQNTCVEDDAELAISKYGSIPNFYDKTPISCKVVGERSIYVSADGLVYPCCFLATQAYAMPKHYNRIERQQLFEMLQQTTQTTMSDDGKDGKNANAIAETVIQHVDVDEGDAKTKEEINKCKRLPEQFSQLDPQVHRLRDIVEGQFFRQVSDSWTCSSVDDGKLRTCSRSCGAGLSAWKGMFLDSKIAPSTTRQFPPVKSLSSSSSLSSTSNTLSVSSSHPGNVLNIIRKSYYRIKHTCIMTTSAMVLVALVLLFAYRILLRDKAPNV